MKIINYGETGHDLGAAVIALGFFDSLHMGHRKLIQIAKDRAEALNASVVVFTFSNSPYELKGMNRKEVLSYSERTAMLEKLGVDAVMSAEFNGEFSQLNANAFLNGLTKSLDLSAVIIGEDYKFAKGAAANSLTIAEYFFGTGVEVLCVPFEKHAGEKISTRGICELLLQGEIAYANALLGYNFFVHGTVEHGYKLGRTLGFPTANIKYPQQKIMIKAGVYKSVVEFNGRRYLGISNVGSRPTFSDDDIKVETYIEDFSEDIYGSHIRVEFAEFMREIKKFDSAHELRAQLERDKLAIKK